MLVDGPGPGPRNMAVDEAIAELAPATGLVTLRLYSFDPPCITIGRFQGLDGFIDVASCKRDGVDITRRATGGLAILHRDDFTYGFTRPLDSKAYQARVARDECFREVASGVAAALWTLGLRARVTAHGSGPAADGWCFEREFGIDVEWKSRKICGSAQRIWDSYLLQHGTLFLGELNDTAAVGCVTGGKARSGHPISVSEACGRLVAWDEMALAFRRGFEDACGVRLREECMRPEEVELSRILEVEKYATGSWIAGDSAQEVCDIIIQNSSAGGIHE